LLFGVADPDLELPRHGGRGHGQVGEAATIARTASATHSSAVGAHASIRRSAVSGTRPVTDTEFPPHGRSLRPIEGVGHARRNPRDRTVPEIGDELAAGRALIDLSSRLVQLAAADIVESTRHR
jgi:hypothetical protein